MMAAQKSCFHRRKTQHMVRCSQMCRDLYLFGEKTWIISNSSEDNCKKSHVIEENADHCRRYQIIF
jgi:hypothetical protein